MQAFQSYGDCRVMSKGIVDYGIWYKMVSDVKLIWFLDNDWASFLDGIKIFLSMFSTFALERYVKTKKSKKQLLNQPQKESPEAARLWIMLFGWRNYLLTWNKNKNKLQQG